MVSGAQAVTELSFDDGASWGEVSQRGLGLDNINVAWSTSTQSAGGGENIEYMERSGYAQAQVAFAVDDSAIARRLFFGNPSAVPSIGLGRRSAMTIDTGVIVGGPNWSLDMSDQVSGWSLVGRGSHQFFPRVGGAEVAEFKDADLFGIGIDLTLPQIYWGDKAEQLHRHRRDEIVWAMVWDTDAKMFVMSHVSLENMPRQTPTNSRITNSLTMHNNGPFVSDEAGLAAVEIDAANADVTIPGVAKDDEVVLVVTEYPAGEAAANVTGGPTDVSVGGVGVYPLGKATGAAHETLTFAHALAGEEEIKGYAMAGPDFDPNAVGRAGWKHGRNMKVRHYPRGKVSGQPREEWQGRVTLQMAAGAEGRRRISGSQGINGAVSVTSVA